MGDAFMNAIVIEHVPVADLPKAWRDQLAQASDARVTVRIEAEQPTAAPADESFVTDDPAFGIWRDREDMADVAAYIQRAALMLARPPSFEVTVCDLKADHSSAVIWNMKSAETALHLPTAPPLPTDRPARPWPP
jgi:hypothetical protein